MSNEIKTFLSKEPLKQAASTLYSIQRGGVSKEGVDISQQFPQLASHLKMDFSFLDRYLGDALNLLPEKYRGFTKSRLDEFALPMNAGEKKQLSGINLYDGSTA